MTSTRSARIAALGLVASILIAACGGGDGLPADATAVDVDAADIDAAADAPPLHDGAEVDAAAPDATVDAAADATPDAGLPDAPPGMRILRLIVSGPARGHIQWGNLSNDDTPFDGECNDTCTFIVRPGTRMSLIARSPSRFTGWSGACAGSEDACTVTVDSDTTVIANVTKDDGEVWSQLGGWPGYNAVAFDSRGDLIVVAPDSGGSMRKLTSAGALLWSVPVPEGYCLGVGTDASGNVFAAYQPSWSSGMRRITVVALSAAGAPLWSDVIEGAHAPATNLTGSNLHALAVTTTGDVALVASTGSSQDFVRLYQGSGSGAGTVRWTASVPRQASAIAAMPAGGLAVLTDEPPDYVQLQILSLDRDGNVTVLDQGFEPYHGMIATDPSGHYAIVTSGFSSIDWTLSGPGGFRSGEDYAGSAFADVGIGIDPGGHLVMALTLDDHSNYPGMLLRQFNPGGTVRWSLHKPPNPSYRQYGVAPRGSAVGPGGEIAVVGGWFYQSWIAVYRPPATISPRVAPRASTSDREVP